MRITMSYYTSVIIMILLALGVFSILILENDRIAKQKKKMFLMTNVLIVLAALAECAGVHMGGKEYIPRGCLAAIDYTLTPMTGGALITLMQRPHKKNRIIWKILIFNGIFQVIAAFRGWMIRIDDQNRYTHGPFYPVYMILYSMIIISIAIKMVSYGKSFRKQNRKSLYATILFIFVGIGIQEIMGQEYRVAYLALSFGIIFMFIHYSEYAQLRLDDRLMEQQEKILNDPLTGVLSRFAYKDTIKEYRQKRPEDLVVFLIDINGLKLVNDSIGHEAGDELICGAARCIEESVGLKGQTFRIGGDEFVVLNHMNKEQMNRALINLRNKTKSWSGEKVKELSVSVGYVLAKDYEGFAVEELVREADKVMYQQKKAFYAKTGRDRRRHETINVETENEKNKQNS